MSVLDPARRAGLQATKLRALMSDAGIAAVEEPMALGGGVALQGDDRSGWVLLPAERGAVVERGLGGALAWAVRREVSELRLLTDGHGGVLARRALGLRLPVEVFELDGRTLTPAAALPLAHAVTLDDRHREFAALILEGGAEPVEEHGVLVGEVEGLEVCRVVDDPVTGDVRLEVGVGAHDRETFQMLHGDRPTIEALADVVHSVRGHRAGVPGAPSHPLRRLAASRLLRARLVADPSWIGAGPLVAVEPPIARTNLNDEVPCVAREIGTSRIVVCTTGIDLEVVPWAVDAVATCEADECLIAAPDRDVIDIQQRLAGLVVVPTRFVPVARTSP